MIQKLIPDLMPRELGSTKAQSVSERKPGDGGGKLNEFAELMKGPNRTERNENKPGRESEGKRSRESEAVSPQQQNKISKKPAAKSGKAAKSNGLEETNPQAGGVAQAPTEKFEVKKANAALTEEVSSIEGSARGSDNGSSAPVSAELTSLIEKRNEAVESRQDAIVGFMEKMQNMFGIAPEKIVEAFSQMSEEAMMAPPEESMKEFLAALELPQEKMADVSQLYGEMLAVTKEADLNEKIASMDATLVALDETLDEVTDIPGFSEMSLKEQTLAQLNQAADKLNEAMVQVGGPIAPFEAQRAADDMNARLAQLVRETKTEEWDEAAAATPVALGATGPASAPAKLATAAAVVPDASMTKMMATANANGGQSASFRNGAGGDPSKESAFASELKKDVKSSETSVSSESLTPSLETIPAPLAAPASGPNFQVTSSSSAAATLAQPMTADEEAANVKDILSQARIALKNGGGEIQMDLKPEGVGKVRLKVSVDDGQVNIQMLTENDTAKKMLEKGLGELKSSLAEHQLKVENLKVDVGSEIKKHMDQNTDSGREQARQFASDFMGRFNDERRSFRQGLVENSGIRRSYGGGTRPEMNADMNDRVAAANRANGGATKRLNLVA